MKLADRLPSNPIARAAIVGGLAVAVTLVITQLLMPGTGNGRGTPMAILFDGLVVGLVNALAAAGLVLVYRTVRVINFAQTAIGAAGGVLFFQLIQLTEIPFVLAFPAGLLLAGLLGLLFDLVFGRRFLNASRLVLTVATIAVGGLSAISTRAVSALPFFGDQTLAQVLGSGDIRRDLPFPGFDFQVGSFPLPFGFSEIFAIEVSVVALILVGLFFRFTRGGVAVRALAENRERAGLLGISVGSLSSVVWGISGLLGGAAVILNGSLTVPAAAQGVAPGVLLPALAAAVIARFSSIPIAVAASVVINVLIAAFVHSFEADASLVPVGILLVIGTGLLIRQRGGRSEAGAGVSWQSSDEQRPIPVELSRIGTVRTTRWVLIAIGVLAVVVYPYLVDTGPIILGGVVALFALVALSVVVLTGWAGQVSLGQFAFTAVGAVVGGSLTSRVGLPFWVAVPIASAVSGGLAVLVGIPALRIRGLFLAVTTLAFAYAINEILFDDKYFGWLLPTEIERPTLFFLDFSDQRSMYYLCVASLLLGAVVVLNLRKSRTGRILIACRDNEAAVQSFGVALVRTKLMAFAISGALAGFAGVVYAHQQLGVNAESFAAQKSIDVFLFSVLGGVTSVGGAILGSGSFNVLDYFFAGNPIVQFFQPFSVLIVLYVAPGGLASMLTRVRDEWLRVVAQRRQIVVPSLFADFDADALERRLVPLRAPDQRQGVREGDRYALPSVLYRTGENDDDLLITDVVRPSPSGAQVGVER